MCEILYNMPENKHLFNWKDYLELNKDLGHLTTEEEAVNHWNECGYSKMRLCNKSQLEVVNEFGNELILYIPYYYYLHKNNLLFDHKITTFRHMKPFYYFLDGDRIIEKQNNRDWIHEHNRPLVANNSEYTKYFNNLYWVPPPYKQFYANNVIQFEKPILVVHNKYNLEWGVNPINYIGLDTLKYIFNTLSDKYQIVYIRPKSDTTDYSYDNSAILDDFKDYELIEQEFNQIITFNDLLKKYPYKYNELQLMLFSKCDNYISSQGGSTYLISYFFKRMLILHQRGGETWSGAYEGWFNNVNNEPDKTLQICTSSEDLRNNTKMFE